MTAAIVLAAGLGRRLAGVTSLPKWLTPVGATCPATAQLTALASSEIDTVFVVVGDEPTEIRQHTATWENRLAIELIPNEHSATRNNWYSMVLGLRRVHETGHDDVLLLNSDLFASPSWFEASISAVRCSDHPAALSVDPTKGRTDEAMKVAIDATTGQISGIGKTGIDSPAGEYVGLAWWTQSAAAELLLHLNSFIGHPTRSDHWYEHGIDDHIAAGGDYGSAPVASPEWVEIDDEQDLLRARELEP